MSKYQSVRKIRSMLLPKRLSRPQGDPFNPTTDAGNQGLQASAGNDPVMSAATFAPTNPTDIFNIDAQNQGGQDVTALPDNNSAPD